MIAQRQVRSGTSVAVTLALAAALTVGGMAGYALRGLALAGDLASLKPAPQVEGPYIKWAPDPTSEDWRGSTADTPRCAADGTICVEP